MVLIPTDARTGAQRHTVAWLCWDSATVVLIHPDQCCSDPVLVSPTSASVHDSVLPSRPPQLPDKTQEQFLLLCL